MPRLSVRPHRWLRSDRSAADLRALLEALPDATALLDHRGVIREANQAWQQFARGVGAKTLQTTVGSNYLTNCEAVASSHRGSAHQAATAVRAVLTGQAEVHRFEYRCDQTLVPVWFQLRYTAFGGRRPGVLVCRIDISGRKAAEQAAADRADHDPLTGLANSARLRERLTAALVQQPDSPYPPGLGVVFIDLDRFKPVNDAYGHAAGDQVLVEVARRLRSTVGQQDTVARVGGDEFAIVLPRTTAEALRTLERRLSAVLHAAHDVHGVALVVGASIGSHLARRGEKAADVLAAADRRMYEAKQR